MLWLLLQSAGLTLADTGGGALRPHISAQSLTFGQRPCSSLAGAVLFALHAAFQHATRLHLLTMAAAESRSSKVAEWAVTWEAASWEVDLMAGCSAHSGCQGSCAHWRVAGRMRASVHQISQRAVLDMHCSPLPWWQQGRR